MSETERELPRGLERWVEALSWHETLTEAGERQLTGTVIRDWQAWYTVPENQWMFDRVSRIAADVNLYRAHSKGWKADSTGADEYDPSVPVAEWRKAKPSPPALSLGTPPTKRRYWLTGGFAVALVIVIAALTSWSQWFFVHSRQGGGPITFQTDVGGLKNVRLSDGSRITLGGRTKLSVAFSSQARSVQLTQGEAWFKVAHNPRWPFLVHAGDGVIRAVGTAFLVTRDSDRVVVTVTEGTIAVTAPPLMDLSRVRGRENGLSQRPPPIRVIRGERVSYGDNGALASVVHTDTHAAVAWTDGRLIFADEPLRYVIEKVNRYFPQRIVATSSVGNLRFSGVIIDGEIREWLRGLPTIFPIIVDERSADICVSMRAANAKSSCAAAR